MAPANIARVSVKGGKDASAAGGRRVSNAAVGPAIIDMEFNNLQNGPASFQFLSLYISTGIKPYSEGLGRQF